MAWGLSFGSFWATQMAAADDRFAACAVMYTSFQPANWPYFEMASPAFKSRFMYMTNTFDDESFDNVVKKIDVKPLSAKLTMPYFVMAGEDDSLSDIGCTFEHMNAVIGPKTLVVYAGEEHGIFGARSSQLSTPFFTVIADWLADRASGVQLDSTLKVVDSIGKIHSKPWDSHQHYTYGAPLGVDQLFSEEPPIGLS